MTRTPTQVGVAVATFSASSGAHFNPSVTLALVLSNDFAAAEAPAYLGAQLVGALGAAMAVAKLASGAVGMPAAAPSPVAEASLTALLVFSCFAIGDNAKVGRLPPAMVPVLVGCVIFGINVFFGHLGAAINPAMAFGPRLVAAVVGGWGRAALDGASSYVLGSLLGGVLGATLFARVVGNRAYDKVCSWICAEGPK